MKTVIFVAPRATGGAGNHGERLVDLHDAGRYLDMPGRISTTFAPLTSPSR